MKKIQTSAVGCSIGESIHRVTKREVMAYAAAIGDASDGCFDDIKRDVVAPLPFCVVLEWPVVSGPRALEALGVGEAEQSRAVHVSQDTSLTRPLLSGLEILTTGSVVEVRSTRIGTYVCYLLISQEKSTNEILATSLLGQIFFGVESEGPDIALPTPAPRGESASHATASRAAAKIEVARGFAHTYTECSRIWNPIHTEREAAAKLGFPEIIVHGSANWALAGQSIVKFYCNGDHGRLRRLSARFRKPVLPASSIEILHAQSTNNEVVFEVLNGSRDVAVDCGHASIVSAGRSE